MNLKTLIAVGTTLFFWSSSFVAIKVGLESYSPENLALLRYLIASLVLIPLFRKNRLSLPKIRDFPPILILGFLGFTVYNVALNYGETGTTAGAASFLIGQIPIFTTLLAIILLNERPNYSTFLGMAISFVGVFLITLGEGKGFSFEPKALFILLAAISESLYFVLQKPYLSKYKPIELTACSIWAGTAFMLVFFKGLVEEVKKASISASLSGIYLGIFPAALAYITWNYALSIIPASRLTSCLYFSPAITIIISWIWLKELPSILSLIGGGIAMVGALIVIDTRALNQRF